MVAYRREGKSYIAVRRQVFLAGAFLLAIGASTGLAYTASLNVRLDDAYANMAWERERAAERLLELEARIHALVEQNGGEAACPGVCSLSALVACSLTGGQGAKKGASPALPPASIRAPGVSRPGAVDAERLLGRPPVPSP